MGIFGKRKDTPPFPPGEVEEETPQAPEGVPGVDRDWDRTVDGPFDVAERPELDTRLDLGPLRVPMRQGMEMRLDVEPGSTRMVGLTCTVGANKVQVQVFAAPRSLGIWEEIRAALAEGITKAGGSAETAQGVFGPELRTRMPGRATDGRVAYQPARFLGVDGPRWFLRVVVNGPAATDDTALTEVLDFVREVVVNRGEEPKPPRELLELTPPQRILDAAAARRKAAAAAPAAGQQPAPDPSATPAPGRGQA